MDESGPIVYIIDDDPSISKCIKELVQSVHLEGRVYDSAQEFLAHARPSGPCCLVLDVRMPGLSGLDLQERLAQTEVSIPIVFITGFASIPASVRAMQAGAVDFIEKPFDNQRLLDAVRKAIERSRLELREWTEVDEIRTRVKTLTPREYEVFALVVKGAPNKLIAAELATGEQTIKVHRSRVMRKMNARSLADLVRMAQRLDL